MAKVKIMGNAMVVFSTLKLEDIKQAEKRRPEVLRIVDPETKDVVFAIGTGSVSSIGDEGVTFADASPDGFAQITMVIRDREDIEDLKGEIADRLGTALVNLGKIEVSLPSALNEIAAEKAAIDGLIEIIG